MNILVVFRCASNIHIITKLVRITYHYSVVLSLIKYIGFGPCYAFQYNNKSKWSCEIALRVALDSTSFSSCL